MDYPLSQYERSLLNELENIFDNEYKKQGNQDNNHGSVCFNLEEYLKYKDWITELKDEGYITKQIYDNDILCTQLADFNSFDQSVDNKNKKAKRMKRRDWYIAGFGAAVGAVMGVVGTLIIQLIK